MDQNRMEWPILLFLYLNDEFIQKTNFKEEKNENN